MCGSWRRLKLGERLDQEGIPVDTGEDCTEGCACGNKASKTVSTSAVDNKRNAEEEEELRGLE